MKQVCPYGAWPSPILPSMVADKSAKISDTIIRKGQIFWSQSLAEEKGRNAVMMWDGETTRAVLPRPLSAKSKVHEYGGAAFAVEGDFLYFVLADDQRLYALDIHHHHVGPEPLSPEAGGYRFADIIVDAPRQRLIAVCEQHDEQGVENFLAAIPLDGSQNITRLAQGEDFYSSPRISPDGTLICWISWNNPDMPWDASQLWLAELGASGDPSIELANSHCLAGNGDESICQPQWSPSNQLYFITDRSNWWNIWTIERERLTERLPEAVCVFASSTEFATPPWVFGMANYGFLSATQILASFTREGKWELAIINTEKFPAVVDHLASVFSVFQNLSCDDGQAVFIAASASHDNSVQHYKDGHLHAITNGDSDLEDADISFPESISFPTSNQGLARALFYPPQNKAFVAVDEKPPLMVICHGGPTGASESSLNLKIQFWTSRGFAVADVNYRGSTGYGRQYRHSLFDQWGVYDVDDVCAVVNFLSEKGLVDAERTIIKGSSAGGYTVLAALAFRDTFKAGVSLYGIGDLEMLAKDTHKFEARYLDKLVGPYPEQADTYRERSPIHSVDKISCPLLIFQGLEDKVVPPNQAQSMFDAVKANGEPVAYVTYANEAHGFRDASNICHMLEAELVFYAKVFNIPLAHKPDVAIDIVNLDTH